MAREINAQFVSRVEIHALPPTEIVVDPSDNTRMYKFDVDSLAESLLKGQHQPCVVRALPDKRVKMVAGFRRHTAAMAIWKRQEQEGVPEADRFKLLVKIQAMDANTAMDVNIVENVERDPLSPVEFAHAIYKYRIQRGWMGDEGTQKIAKLFRKYTRWVTDMENLLNLSESEQFLIHQHHVTQGREGVSVDAAKILLKVDEEKREELLQEAQKAKEIKGVDPKGKPLGEGKVAKGKSANSAKSTKAPKGLSAADLKAAGKKTGAIKEDTDASKKRSNKEILNMFDPNVELDGPVRRFKQKVTDWINGEMEDDEFDQYQRNFLSSVAVE